MDLKIFSFKKDFCGTISSEITHKVIRKELFFIHTRYRTLSSCII